MNIRLTAIEARIIGALIEKQITTPDQYPLSLNALINACNQKSNREPLMQLDEPTVKFVVEGLGRRHMVVEKSGFGSRVPKYQQIFCNTEFGSLKFTPQETAIVCELLLRGPQTPGELRARAPRMAEFPGSWRGGIRARGAGDPRRAAASSRNSRANPAAAIRAGRSCSKSCPHRSRGHAPTMPRRTMRPARRRRDRRATRELVARVAALESEIAALRAELAALKQDHVE